MAYSPHQDFAALYKAYTSDPASIGAQLTRRMAELAAADPLLVSTGSDVVRSPGRGGAPVAESFRRETRGFIELASISHLGTAVPWLARLRELDDPGWRDAARRLLDQIGRVRRTNTPALWRDGIGVSALRGYEEKICAMVEYACRVTADFLQAGLADERRMSLGRVRAEYLDPVGSASVRVSINDVMVATFALAFLDIGHRIIGWVGSHSLDWSRVMIMISGRSGRPTAGLTWQTNNMCHLLWRASGNMLSPERLYIAPFAPPFVLADVKDAEAYAALDRQYREVWLNTRASVELARAMFDGYPAFEQVAEPAPVLRTGSMAVREMPMLRSPDDRYAAITRLRVVMEDPAQLLSNAVAQYIIDALVEHGNRPAEVTIPGFTGVTYPGA